MELSLFAKGGIPSGVLKAYSGIFRAASLAPKSLHIENSPGQELFSATPS